MKYIFLLSIPVFMSVLAFSQQPINQLTKDENGNDMLLGCCTREALNREPFAAWFNTNYFNYKVDTSLIASLKQNMQRKQFLLFMGTWCGDSKREVPRILKVLDYCGVRDEQVKIVMVSNAESMYKQSPAHEEKGLNILRVPTLIVYENNTEINRLIEYPVESLEKDLLKILSRQLYKPNYAKAQPLTPVLNEVK
ncbi:thioredoxin family protein [Lacibacter sp. MH-610]|uniref:thioredoxin family protein n=1 Tax=Lacibacter sp. MH-610 TaxID=3020883 RepID=UPI0038922CA5